MELSKIIEAAKTCREDSQRLKKVAQIVEKPSIVSVWEKSAAGNPAKLELLEELKNSAGKVKEIQEKAALARTPKEIDILNKFNNRSFWKNFKTEYYNIKAAKFRRLEEIKLHKPSSSMFNASKVMPWVMGITLGAAALGAIAYITKDLWMPLFKKDYKSNSNTEEINKPDDTQENKQIKADVTKDTTARQEHPAETAVKAEEVKPEITASNSSYTVKNGDSLWNIANTRLKEMLNREPSEVERQVYMEQIITSNYDKYKLKWNAEHTHVNIHPGQELTLPEWDEKLTQQLGELIKHRNSSVYQNEISEQKRRFPLSYNRWLVEFVGAPDFKPIPKPRFSEYGNITQEQQDSLLDEWSKKSYEYSKQYEAEYRIWREGVHFDLMEEYNKYRESFEK